MIESWHGLGLGHGSRAMRVTGQLNDRSRGSQNVTHCQLCVPVSEIKF